MPRSLSQFTAPCPSTSAAHKILLSWLFVRKRFVRECFSCSPASIPDIVCSLICLINCDGFRFPGEPADGTYADHLPVASPAMISVAALIQGTKVISSSTIAPRCLREVHSLLCWYRQPQCHLHDSLFYKDHVGKNVKTAFNGRQAQITGYFVGLYSENGMKSIGIAAQKVTIYHQRKLRSSRENF